MVSLFFHDDNRIAGLADLFRHFGAALNKLRRLPDRRPPVRRDCLVSGFADATLRLGDDRHHRRVVDG